MEDVFFAGQESQESFVDLVSSNSAVLDWDHDKVYHALIFIQECFLNFQVSNKVQIGNVFNHIKIVFVAIWSLLNLSKVEHFWVTLDS